MAGLESIALAVAHLEQEQQRAVSLSRKTQETESSSTSTPVMTWDAIRSSPSMPSRQGFGNTQPRLISLDTTSTFGVADAASAPPSSPTNSHSSSGSSCDWVTPTKSSTSPIMTPSLKALEDSLMPTNAVMPSPPKNEVIMHVNEQDVLCGRGGETNHVSIYSYTTNSLTLVEGLP